MKISIIIPCYNEEDVLETTNKRIIKVMNENNYRNYEILYINDGSGDRTYEILSGFAKKKKKIKVLNFSRNFGHEAATSAGINYCSGDIAFIIDADLQDPPELIPDMISLQKKEGCNIVFGVRKQRKGETFLKKITSKLFYRLLSNFSDTNIPMDAGDFRLIDRHVIDAFKQCNERNKYVRGIISWIGFKQVPFYFEREARFAGKTKYSYFKLFKLGITALFYFSKKPLTLAINLGFFCIFIGLGLLIYAFVGKFTQAVSGWTSTVIIIVFFGGIQLFTIGILGQYIGNVFDEVKKRPEFIVENKINFEK